VATVSASDRLTLAQLEIGGAVAALRARGIPWPDLADALGLRDAYHAQRLAFRYLAAQAVAERAEAQGRRARPVQYPPADLGRG
jgi:hypothetical protein